MTEYQRKGNNFEGHKGEQTISRSLHAAPAEICDIFPRALPLAIYAISAPLLAIYAH